jgi:hypothetical protein
MRRIRGRDAVLGWAYREEVSMKALLLFVSLGLSSLLSLAQTAPEGIWQGYDGK